MFAHDRSGSTMIQSNIKIDLLSRLTQRKNSKLHRMISQRQIQRVIRGKETRAIQADMVDSENSNALNICGRQMVQKTLPAVFI